MKVLVTGGSGTLGSEVCRQLLSQGHMPVVLSRDFAKQIINCPQDCLFEIGDVQDFYFVRHVCRKHEIEAVVHCAANKHLYVCEDNPFQAVENNIIGSKNMLSVIEQVGIKHALFVSSDKACDHNNYGMSKLWMEKMAAWVAIRSSININCIRLGNIIGSSGSVVAIWSNRVKNGEDITVHVCNKESSYRFVVTLKEAGEFVLEHLFVEDKGCIFTRPMSVLDISMLAKVMTAGTASKVIEQELAPELQHAFLIRRAESVYVREHCDFGKRRFIIYPDKCMQKQWEYSTKDRVPMNEEETKEFVARCLENK